MSTPRFLILAGTLAFSFPAFSDEPTKEQLDFFEGKIRPILTEKCYKCHSLESGKSKGGLTLDLAKSTLKGGETGPGVVPGKPAESLIYKAVTYEDKDLQMPPTSSGGKLDAQQIADIETWIKMGAPDPRKDAAKAKKLSGLNDSARGHWAYQPIKSRIKVPINKNQQWCRTPIDSFILQKLEARGMLPSPDASRETLLRRAYYDILGLPPDPAEIVAFLADESPNAWEKVVDRLLASPHYGERWGRYWLNSARYADTIGGDGNVNNGRQDYRYTNAWTYRDYVIRAFNEDKPYNQFIIEQLAADQLYPVKSVAPAQTADAKTGSPDSKIATPKAVANKAPTAAPPAPAPAASTAKTSSQAIPVAQLLPTATTNTGSMMDSDGMMMMGGGGRRSSGVELKGSPNLAALGFLTVGMRFNNMNDIIDDRINVFSKAFLGITVACARCHDHMFDPVPQSDYYALHGIFASSEEPADKPVIAEPSPGLKQDYQKRVAELMKENSDIYFREVEHWLSVFQEKPADYLRVAMARGGQNQAERQKLIDEAKLDTPLATYFQRVLGQNHPVFGPVRRLASMGGGPKMAGAISEMRRGDRYNSLVLDELAKASPQSEQEVFNAFAGLMKRNAAKQKGIIAALKGATDGKVSGFSPAEIELLTAPFEVTPASKVTPDWIRGAISGWNNQMTGRARFAFAKFNDLELTHPGAPSRAMVMVDKPSPQNSRLLVRGQAGAPGETVPRGFLSILGQGGHRQQFTSGSGRLDLARAVASNDNPLTPRVLVNRVWLQHFGEGFVRTPDDIGVMSEKPSHPELLEYLSHWFIDPDGGNWSIKRLHKFIMLSRVYQESSHTIPDYVTMDPENRLLWRANVRRLDFESFRDSLLVMAGRLDRKTGGQPVNITDEPYFDENGKARRSIYGYIDRGNVPELMLHFDFSNPDMPNTKRDTTIVPQQALFLMNSPMAVDVARQIIARSEFKGAGDELRRIFTLYRIMFQRQPSPQEIQLGLAFIQNEKKKQADVDAKAPEIAKKNAEIQKRVNDIAKRDNDAKRAVQNKGRIVERKPLTPWETYAHTLLFANEAIYVN